MYTTYSACIHMSNIDVYIHGDANNNCTCTLNVPQESFSSFIYMYMYMYTCICIHKLKNSHRVTPVEECPGGSGCASLFLLHARHSPPTSIQSVIARRVSG